MDRIDATPLTGPAAADVAAKRRWLLGHYEPGSESQYDTVAGKLLLVDTILRNGWIERGETLKLQCLGVAFGDALAQELGMTWTVVEDERGADPALALEGTSIRAFPLTSISKRIEQGQDVNVHTLFSSACESIRRLRDDGA
jgi:Domain of unknown function (DUF3806)